MQTQSPQNTEDIKRIADKSIFHIISFFKTPQRVPDASNYTIDFSNSSYIFTEKDGTKLYADDKFRLYNISLEILHQNIYGTGKKIY